MLSNVVVFPYKTIMILTQFLKPDLQKIKRMFGRKFRRSALGGGKKTSFWKENWGSAIFGRRLFSGESHNGEMRFHAK